MYSLGELLWRLQGYIYKWLNVNIIKSTIKIEENFYEQKKQKEGFWLIKNSISK